MTRPTALRFSLAFFALGSLASLPALGQVQAPAKTQNPAPTAPNSTTEPAPRGGSPAKMHEDFLRQAKQGNIDLLFLGDSITQGWNKKDLTGQGPRQVWDRYYGARHAANFGVGGDRTQHVLWRLEHGEVDGINPKVVVLMIGTNNINSNTPAEIADGVTAIVKRLHNKLPETKILLLAVFPRGENPAPVRDRIKDLNERISKLDDGGKTVRYLDIGRVFLNPNGTISREIMPDSLHLSRQGYALWADAIEPTLHSMLDGR